jgi:glycosyltransferase involved in cell wall biosynthesis
VSSATRDPVVGALAPRPGTPDHVSVEARAGDGARPVLDLALAAGRLGDLAAEAGLRRVHMLAWRDLDDPEAGGSEIHADAVARLWTHAGIDVTMRTSGVAGGPRTVTRDGYRAIRAAGRHAVFPRAAVSEAIGRHGPRDGLVEIWNGMPFFSPLWARGPRVVFCHHVHAEMWRMVLPGWKARFGELIEFTVAPPVYRGSRIITLSESSKRELVDDLGLRDELITVVPPGIDTRFAPGAPKSERPLVVAVGRLEPVKRFHLLVDGLVELQRRHPGLEAVIIGEGSEREALEDRIARAGATGWLRLPGRVDDDELVATYQRAWVLASASAREGWGMTITEAAACGTPAVATRIAGHADALEHGVSGLLAADAGPELVQRLDAVLGDPSLRDALTRGALARAESFTWEATAEGTLDALAQEAHRHRARTRRHARRRGLSRRPTS